MPIGAFDKLAELLDKTAFGAKAPTEPTEMLRAAARMRRGKGKKQTSALALSYLDHPTTRFKLAACLYILGQGGPVKPSADACGIGKATLSRWLNQFAHAMCKHVKPLYMPAKPWDTPELNAVRGNFASRRGIPRVALACDGSHIPFHPRCGQKMQGEYRNYKGWHSILAVAFVDSYYRFFDLDVGAPGKAGDNTVLKHNWLMAKIKEDPDRWLGEHGVILGDSGASDGDAFFLNPYHAPTEPERCWFNFCHSSTRFYVEETFGRWKNKWRFLMNPINCDHTLTSKLIYTSAILHNYCTVCARDDDHEFFTHSSQVAWGKFLGKYQAELCPSCRRRGARHCVHQAMYRNGAATTAGARRAPSLVREGLCAELWEWVKGPDPLGACGVCEDEVEVDMGCAPGFAQNVREAMEMRARGRGADRFAPIAL